MPPDLGDAAIDEQFNSRDVPRLIGRKECEGFGDFVRRAGHPSLSVAEKADRGAVFILGLISASGCDLAGEANDEGKGKVRAKVWHLRKRFIFLLPTMVAGSRLGQVSILSKRRRRSVVVSDCRARSPIRARALVRSLAETPARLTGQLLQDFPHVNAAEESGLFTHQLQQNGLSFGTNGSQAP